MAKRLGEVLRAVRRECGLSIRDVERLSGLPTGTISQIETGVRADPGFSTVARLSKAIGIGLDDLVKLTEGRAGGLSGRPPETRALLGEMAKLRAETQRVVQRIDRVTVALGVPAKAPKRLRKRTP